MNLKPPKGSTTTASGAHTLAAACTKVAGEAVDFNRPIAKAKGPDHPDLSEWHVALGQLYHTNNRRAEAEAQYQRSVEVIEKTKGPDEPDVAKALQTLAKLYVYGGQEWEAKAAPVYKRMIAILEKAKGPEDFRSRRRVAWSTPRPRPGISPRRKPPICAHWRSPRKRAGRTTAT